MLGINTRKYHGLLVAAFHPPGDRRVCLEKLDEEISIGNSTYPLGANEFQDAIFPQGHSLLREFSVSPFPKYVYNVQDVEVQKSILMPHEKNTAIIIYNVANKGSFDAKIRVFPIVNWRHFHSVTNRWKNQWSLAQKQKNDEVSVDLSNPKAFLMLQTTSGHYTASGKWIERVYFREDAVRGESCSDDWYQLGFFEIFVKANRNEDFAVTAIIDESEQNAREVLDETPITLYDLGALREKEIERCEKYVTRFYETHQGIVESDWLSWVILATDAFTVKGMGDKQTSVIAGYPWFESWGRDTFISMPGLMLATGRYEDARKVFLTFKEYCRDGLVPNILPDQAGQPAYNTVDATLWYVNAVLQYLKYTGDFRFVEGQLWRTLKEAVENHVKGTLFSIRMDDDGLLSHGSQLTWMDVAVDGRPVTPRAGKAVEVQALWYNALKTMEVLAKKFNEINDAERYVKIAEKARKSFSEKFWNLEKNCLFDVVNANEKDDSLRPNQIIAAALSFTMLDVAKNEKIVNVVQRELVTPYGLRTLARNDPKYVGVYSGDRRSRDIAYHNGTVWPWLLGPFATAFLKTVSYAEPRREYTLKNFLLPLFVGQTSKAGLGTLSEIFDGEPPHMPRGCIAQAWSIAEPFRACLEDVMQIRPKYERPVLQDLG